MTGISEVQATFSESVEGESGSTEGNLVSGDFEYNGDQSVTGVTESGATSTATLSLDSNLENADTGSDTLDVTANNVYDAADNTAPEGQDVTVNDDSNDNVAPSITSAETMDTDGNGKIDHYKVTFDEAVDDSTITNHDGSSTKADISGTWSVGSKTTVQYDPTVSDDTQDDSVIYVGFEEAGSTDTDATPELTTASATLEDDSNNGNILPDVAEGDVSETDGASPVVTGAAYRDNSGDGTVDKVDVDFSETVDYTASSTPSNDWSLTANGITNLAVESSQSSSPQNGESITIDVTADSGITGADGNQPTIDYSQNGGEGVVDQASSTNEAVSSTAVSMTDSAVPQILSSNVVGTTVEGSGDTIDITFTEDVTQSEAETKGNWAFESPVSSSISTTNAGFSYSSKTLTVTLDEGTDEEFLKNGDEVKADPAGTSISDGNGQQVPDSAVTSSSTVSGDSSAPTVSSVTTKDRDSDGKTDAAEVVFDEEVDDSTITASAWSIGGQQADSINTVTADDSTVEFRISQDGGKEVSGTEAKEVTTSSSTVTDLAGNSFTDIGTGDVSETDGAAPVVTGFEAEEGSRRATVNFSEQVTDQSENQEALTSEDFVYTDDSSGDVTSISSVSHDTSAEMATVILDAQAASSDVDEDDINFEGDTVEDKASSSNSADETKVAMSDGRDQISLTSGWNLVSTPHVQANSTTELLNGVSENSVLAYDQEDSDSNGWVTATDDMQLEDMDAVFIDSTEPQEISLNRVSDAQTTPPTEVLESGWNLVGPSLNVEDNSNLKDAGATVFSSVKDSSNENQGLNTIYSPGFNPSGEWTDTDQASTPFESNLEAFEGYWAYMDSSDELAGQTT